MATVYKSDNSPINTIGARIRHKENWPVRGIIISRRNNGFPYYLMGCVNFLREQESSLSAHLTTDIDDPAVGRRHKLLTLP